MIVAARQGPADVVEQPFAASAGQLIVVNIALLSQDVLLTRFEEYIRLVCMTFDKVSAISTPSSSLTKVFRALGSRRGTSRLASRTLRSTMFALGNHFYRRNMARS